MDDIDGAIALPGFMPNRLSDNAPVPNFDSRAIAKSLLRGVRVGTLATIDRNTGHPFASVVNVASDMDGSPLILVSRLSSHTANLEKDGRASLLLASRGPGDALAHPRLTVLGTFAALTRGDQREARARRRFLARHPKAELYAGFADFSLWRLDVVSAHLNAGFARAADLKAADIMTDMAGAENLIDAEPRAVGHMNADHADAVRLYAIKLLDGEDGPWRLAGFDPEGLDLMLDDTILRLALPQRVTTSEELRKVLVDLAAKARAR